MGRDEDAVGYVLTPCIAARLIDRLEIDMSGSPPAADQCACSEVGAILETDRPRPAIPPVVAEAEVEVGAVQCSDADLGEDVRPHNDLTGELVA